MTRKILTFGAAIALGAAMTTGAMAAHVGGGMTMGGGHAMTMGGAHTWSGTPHMGTWGGARTGAWNGARTGTATGAWANRSWAGGNWGHHHRRNLFIGGLGGLYAFSGYPYDCYNWPYHYGPPYNSCYGYGYGY